MNGLVVAACLTGAFSGGILAVSWVGLREDARRQRQMRMAVQGESKPQAAFECGGLAARVLSAVRSEGAAAYSARYRRVLALPVLGLGLGDAHAMLARAGLSDGVDPRALRSVRVKAMAVGFAAGAVAGLPFSIPLSALLAVAGFLGGYACVPWALKREAAERNADMERHLSEMLEVVVLGLRSGLSFERSFALYPRYFHSGLGRAMERAARQWDMGLLTREEALRRLEGEYDSQLLSRVVGSMVRSLRFGTSVAESLEASALEARAVHRSRMEEKVAKVAVKMMLPVGALVLPAMLLLVLGPVLLELVQGF